MRDSDAPLLPIGEVKVRTGLTERRIRYYESLQLLSPRRSEGNQRLYSQSDLERLLEIKLLLESGVSLKGVKNRLSDSRRSRDVEWDADGYFEGKRIAHGDRARHSLYPLREGAAILRRIESDREEKD